MTKTLRRPAALLIGALLVAPWGCGPRLDEKTVASVNGLAVTIQEVDDRYGRLEKEMQAQPVQRRENAANLRQAIVRELINRKLLLAEGRARKISVAPAEVAAAKEKMAASLSPEEFQTALERARTTPERLDASLAEELLIGRLLELESAAVTVSEAELAAHYDKHRADFVQTDGVRARHIVVNSTTDARDIRRRLQAGEAFDEVARDVSLAPDASRGGDLGFFGRGQMPREIEEAAFALQAGQVSNPVETPYGFHVIKVEERTTAKQLSLDEVRERIREELKVAKREESHKNLLERLEKNAVIRYNRDYADILPKH